MTLTFVESLPRYERSPKHDLQKVIREFMDSPGRVAKVELDRADLYKSPGSLYGSMCAAVRRSGYPVRVRMRGYDIYLIKI